MNRSGKRQSQSGNVFFVILLAIAMFAALSYAVFQGSRASSSDLSREQSQMAATEIIAYGNAIAKAVQTLRLRGCTEGQLDFSNTAWTLVNGAAVHGSTHNAGAPTDGSCSVFKSAGASLTAMVMPPAAFVQGGSATSVKAGAFRVIATSIPNTGSAAPDLVLVLEWPRPEICRKINTLLGVNNLPSTAPRHSYTGTAFNGSYPAASLTDTDAMLAGKSSFCTIDTSLNPLDNRYFAVLLAR